MPQLRIATRKSKLALWQAEHVQQKLAQALPDHDISLLPISTRGDQILDRSLAAIGGKGLFLKELEAALLAGEADLAVHSMKDVPAIVPDGFDLPVVLSAGSPFDAFVSNEFDSPEALPKGAVLGTSSLRRAAMMKNLRPDLQIKSLRGNVQTRLSKLDQGAYDAIILAVAGLERMQLDDRITCRLSPEQSLPAIGQGVLGIETRAGDQTTLDAIGFLNEQTVAWRVQAERAVNAKLEGSCHLPIAAYAQHDNKNLRLRACVGSPDGSQLVQQEIRGPVEQGVALGEQLAEALLAAGADKILAALK